jgi:hypothetical protein
MSSTDSTCQDSFILPNTFQISKFSWPQIHFVLWRQWWEIVNVKCFVSLVIRDILFTKYICGTQALQWLWWFLLISLTPLFFVLAKFIDSFVISVTFGFTAYHSESQNNVSECKILRLVCFHTFPDEKQQPTEAVAYTLSMI